jgi:chaperone BCS1
MSTDEKLRIYLTKFGRSHKLFNELLHDLEKIDETGYDENKTVIYSYVKERLWIELTTISQRSFDNVFISKYVKNTLINHLTHFYNNKEWYKRRGIPYQTGIILYGEPGSGKTSIIKSLATYFKKRICILPASNIIDLPNALQIIPNNSFVVIEDIDTSIIVKNRNITNNDECPPGAAANNAVNTMENSLKTTLSRYNSNTNKNQNELTEYAQQYLSEVLNAIDGIVSIDERVIIFTTNDIEKIDKALLRPGRIDVSLYIGYINKEVFKQFICVFYEDDITENINWSLEKISGIKKVTVATLQNEFM